MMRRTPQAIVSLLILLFVFRDYQAIGHLPFYLFFLLIALGASVEMSKLMHASNGMRWRGAWLCGVLFPLCAIVTVIGQRQGWWSIFDIHDIILFCFLLFAVQIGVMLSYIVSVERWLRNNEAQGLAAPQAPQAESPANQLTVYYTTIFSIGLPVMLIVLFSAYQDGLAFVLYAIILTILFDTVSYLFGSLLSRKKRIIAVSPHKSIIGYVGGAVVTVLFSVTSAILAQRINIPLMYVVLSTCVTIIAATIGDLFESALKRSAFKKDSGTLIVGRGGVFDSVDSHLVSIPCFCFLSLWVAQ